MSESGVPRSYQIKVRRASSDNNYLSLLSVEEGSLQPVFDKEEPNYEVVVNPGTSKVHITAVAEDILATVTGDGEKTIKAGENNLDVVVTSQSGNIRTYHLVVRRAKSSNTDLSSFIPSEGELSPGYTNDNNNYTLTIGKDINVVNIEAIPEDSNAKVGGNKNITVESSREITINVIAEDHTIRQIKVQINKAVGVEDIEIANKDIIIVKGEEKDLGITTVPIGETVTYAYEIEKNIISIEGTVVTGLVNGTTKVTVKVVGNPSIEKEIQVTVTSDKIESSVYEVKDKTDRIVIGAEEGVAIGEFKENLLNDPKTINIYDEYGNKLSETDEVRTGLVIKLENNNVVYDEAILIVRGDVDGDGIIDVTDESMVLEDILGIAPIEGYGRYAADVEEDDLLDVSDDSNILDYILKLLSNLN